MENEDKNIVEEGSFSKIGNEKAPDEKKSKISFNVFPHGANTEEITFDPTLRTQFFLKIDISWPIW